MLTELIERYLALRRSLGYELRAAGNHLRAYAAFAGSRREAHVLQASVLEWAGQGPSGNMRRIRFRDVARFARFAHAEDAQHDLLHGTPFPFRVVRRLPYIYTPEELVQIVQTAALLEATFPLRPLVYSTLFGLLAATGLRSMEALHLRMQDVRADGVLYVHRSKCGKRRFVPLHPTVFAALDRYLAARRDTPTRHDGLFVSARGGRLSATMMQYTFRRVLQIAGIPNAGGRRPRIHDIRHTFATRALEACGIGRGPVDRHFVALSTYLGHAEIANTYWYLEATPVVMASASAAAEALMCEEVLS